MTDFEDWEDETSLEQPDLATTLEAMVTNTDGVANATIFYGLSGLQPNDLAQVQSVWNTLPVDYRIKLMRQLIDIAETNFELDYRALGVLSLSDEEPAVRAGGIELLWEDETLELMDRLVEMAQWDDSALVRAAAANALGRFILLGELGDLPERETLRAQDAVVNLLTNEAEDLEVRRRSLEAIANCSHEIVEEAIEEAYNSANEEMQASAIFAMGRTCDERWTDAVMEAFESGSPMLQYEAARASGELEMEAALPILARLAQGDDREIQEVAIWSLGEIGGSYALKILGALADVSEDDSELLDVIEEAIGNASLAGQDLEFDLDD